MTNIDKLIIHDIESGERWEKLIFGNVYDLLEEQLYILYELTPYTIYWKGELIADDKTVFDYHDCEYSEVSKRVYFSENGNIWYFTISATNKPI